MFLFQKHGALTVHVRSHLSRFCKHCGVEVFSSQKLTVAQNLYNHEVSCVAKRRRDERKLQPIQGRSMSPYAYFFFAKKHDFGKKCSNQWKKRFFSDLFFRESAVHFYNETMKSEIFRHGSINVEAIF